MKRTAIKTTAMNEDDKIKLSELFEALSIVEGMRLLLGRMEKADTSDPAARAMITFFRSVLRKYEKKTTGYRINFDDLDNLEIIDETLRKFNKN
jgi:hypothetical protein